MTKEENSPSQNSPPQEPLRATLPKACTGIEGLDDITGGGLPIGRPTLVSGTTGSGKTLFAMEFIVRGATEFGEPGVFISFDESLPDLEENFRSLGFDLPGLIGEKKIAMDSIVIEPEEVKETGAFDLDGLFIRIEDAVKSIGATRVALDALEALFAQMPNERVVEAEVRRLFRWLKTYKHGSQQGLTTVVTAGCGKASLTRLGLEEYIADCVIFLDHRIDDQIGTRRLWVAKYRGSLHGTNEYPFLIGKEGISLLPITSVLLGSKTSSEKVSSGLPELDRLLGGEGYHRGSSILVSGHPGTGKTSLAAAFLEAGCRRQERCLLISYEESPDQIERNMRSIGIDLRRWSKSGLMKIHADRPSLYGMEMHLVKFHDLVREFRPSLVVIDTVSSFLNTWNARELHPFLIRLVDYLKNRGTTALFTCLIPGGGIVESSQMSFSSLMDTWLLLQNQEVAGERTRTISVYKSRGQAHSSQTREFLITSQGMQIREGS